MDTQIYDTDIYDVIVVGGASAGLSAALQLGRLRYRTLVLDSGAPRNRFAGHGHGFLGRDHTSPLQLVAEGARELARYDIEVRPAEVQAVEGASGDFTVRTVSGDELHARRVLLATGVSDELPDVPGLVERWGKNVHHCPFCDGWEHSGERIGVLLDVPEAVHQVLMLRRLSKHVTVFTNGLDVLGPEQRELLESRGVGVEPGRVAEVGGDDTLEVTLASGSTLEVDTLFVRPRSSPRDAMVADLPLERADAFGVGFVTVDEMGRTSVPGLYAAGNVVNPMLSVALSVGAGAAVGYALCGELLTG